MTTKYFALLTTQGAARLANAAALGTKLQITHMAVGDGGGTLPTPDASQTTLIGEKRRAVLNSLSIDTANSSQIIAEQIIPESEGGFWIREIGLFDADGVMIAVANCAETYKPQLAEGSGRTQTVRMIIIVNSTSAVTLKIDPAVVLATRQYVDNAVIEVKAYADDLMAKHVAASNPHKQYLQTANALKELADAGLTAEALVSLGLSGGLATGVVGRVSGEKVFRASGTYTKSPGTKIIKVWLYAAGGGGGGVPAGSSTLTSVGSGGGGGSWVEFTLDALLITGSVPVTIGTGGSGGAAGGGSGGTGGLSSFGSWASCPGGNGGGYSTSSAVAVSAGGAGVTAAPTLSSSVTVIASSRGAPGFPGYLSSAQSGSGGNGGSSPVGCGGGGSSTGGYGNASGGSGAKSNTADTTASSGGAGSAGLCIIREYA